MKRRIINLLMFGAAVVVLVFLRLFPGYVRAKHASALSCTYNALGIAATELEQNGKFTNDSPQYCRIYEFTNRFNVSGSMLQCTLAADSWDYREHSNLLAITTSRVFLFIDKRGVIRMYNCQSPPGY